MAENDFASRIERLEADNNALRQLLLSHILATSVADRDLALSTLQMAELQIEASRSKGKGAAALALSDLIGALRSTIGPCAANDG